MSKKITPLKAFKKLREQNDFLKERNIPKEYRYDDELDIIETALKEYEGAKKHIKALNKERIENLLKLKAFDIIKEKQVDVYILLKTKSLDEYNEWYVGIQDDFMPLTQDEYELLREVLL